MKIPEIDIQGFDYLLPEERIAKYPLPQRDKSKILIYNQGNISHDIFYQIDQYLPEKSLLIMNNTRVIPARLFFKKDTGATIEIFCLEPVDPADYTLAMQVKETCRWKCLVGNLKKWKNGEIAMDVVFSQQSKLTIKARQIARIDDAFIVEFHWNHDISFGEVLFQAGKIPLPPYLNRETEESDKITYQTVYGKVNGSVAAPTAGLHFSDNVLSTLKQKNTVIEEITLHVGAGTFKPLKSNSIAEHSMHSENFSVSLKTLELMKEYYGQITAVGTTTVRTLESLYYIAHKIVNQNIYYPHHFQVDQWEPYIGSYNFSALEALEIISNYLKNTSQNSIKASTSLIIVPGFEIRYINRLITNFHQPRSTLLLLVAAFTGDDWKMIYDYALQNDFRFLSYGDCCLIYR